MQLNEMFNVHHTDTHTHPLHAPDSRTEVSRTKSFKLDLYALLLQFPLRSLNSESGTYKETKKDSRLATKLDTETYATHTHIHTNAHTAQSQIIIIRAYVDELNTNVLLFSVIFVCFFLLLLRRRRSRRFHFRSSTLLICVFELNKRKEKTEKIEHTKRTKSVHTTAANNSTN